MSNDIVVIENPHLVKQIQNMHDLGHSIHEISNHFEIPVSKVVSIISDVKAETKKDKYKSLISKIENDVNEIRTVVEEAGYKDEKIINAYSKLASLYKNLLDDYDKIGDPNDLVADIVENIMNPMLTALAKTIITNLSGLRDQLKHIDGWNDKHSDNLNKIIKSIGQNVSEISNQSMLDLNKYFEANYMTSDAENS